MDASLSIQRCLLDEVSEYQIWRVAFLLSQSKMLF